MGDTVADELVFNYISTHRRTIALYVIVVLCTLPVQLVVLPQLYSRFVDAVRGNGGGDGIRQWLYAIVLLWAVVVGAYVVKNSIESDLVPKYLSFIRSRLFRGTVEKHSKDYRDLQAGEEVTRILSVSRNMKEFVVWCASELLPTYLAFLCMIAFLFYSVPTIGWVVAVGMVIQTGILYVMGRKVAKLSLERETVYMAMSEKITDSYNNLMNVYINNMNKAEIAKNRREEQYYKQKVANEHRFVRTFVAVLSITTLLIFATSLWYLWQMYSRKTATPVQVVAVWFILILYLTTMMQMSNYMPTFLPKIGIVECSYAFIKDIIDQSADNAPPTVIKGGGVSFRNVSFEYPSELPQSPILQRVRLDIGARENVAIVGSSGSGKTTLMKLLCGLYKPTGGRVLIDGTSLHKIPTQYLRQKIVYINQRTHLFNTSLLKNIQYGNRTSAANIQQLLHKYKLHTVFAKLPRGVHTNVGVNGSNLSLGMQKVVMILRGLLRRDGQIFILDEPLAGLDAHTRKKVIRLIRNACRGKTCIVITHDKEILPYMDRVVDMQTLRGT